MTQNVKVSTTKHGNLSPIPETHVVEEGSDSYMLSSGLSLFTVACLCTHAHTHARALSHTPDKMFLFFIAKK